MTYNTEKRAALLRFFSERSTEAYSLDEVCEILLPDGKGKSTVYRLAAKLVEEGVLRKITEQKSRHCTYQYVGGEECAEHLHLKCRDCGKLIHLDEGSTKSLEEKLLKSSGFALDESTLIFGKCAECKDCSHL